MKIFINQQYVYFFAVLLLSVTHSCKDDDKTLPSCDGIEWEYTGEHGPDHWKELCIDYVTCGGTKQTPVNIATVIDDASLTTLNLNYKTTTTHIVNKGHTLQFNVDSGSSMTINGEVYKLLQFHTHTPSEHTINGIQMPLEIHFVHKNDATGNLAVIGVFYNYGNEHNLLKNLIENLPLVKDSTYNSTDTYLPSDLFPAIKNYFTYSGSLTTPPCSEIVTWFVMEQNVESTPGQIGKILAIEHENARPLQALNNRTIRRFIE
jgi:carbonic anhydrase